MNSPVFLNRGSLPGLLVSLTAALGLFPPGRAQADDPAPMPGDYSVNEKLDQHYVDDQESRHLVDVFSPRGVMNAPVVLFVHGGAWISGDKDFYGHNRNIGRFFASHGYVAMVINYGLSPMYKHPEHVRDLARAFAWVRAHAAQYDGDRDRIILCGHSAGGHLVTLLATDDQYLRDPALKLTDADRAAIKAVISISGVYQIPGPDDVLKLSEAMLNQMLAQQNMAPLTLRAPAWLRQSIVMNPFTSVFGIDAKELREASPLSHVRKGLPPFLVLYASKDLPLLSDQARSFARDLKDKDNSVQLEQMPDCDHESIVFRMRRPENQTAKVLLAFLKKDFGGRTARQ